ncbi:MAG: DUF4350 domain-containing protein [Methanogenium sp.]|nr:DUF4350 domain-containing protein [Methanogenium sp.]
MNYGRWIAVILIVISLMIISAHFSQTSLEYSRYNTQWNGTSVFADMVEDVGGKFLYDYKDLNSEANTTLLIIAPDKEFSEEETGILREFVHGGGHLFIADENGVSNGLLHTIGSTMSVVPGNVTSVDMEYNEPSLVICYTKGNATVINGVETIVLNCPSYVSGGEALITSSILSWDDENGNNRIDKSESLSEYPVFVHESIGEGIIFLLSDPSIFINGMNVERGKRDNKQFIQNILTQDKHLIVDQSGSQTAGSDGILSLMNRMKQNTILKIAVITAAVFSLLYAVNRKII